MLFFMYWIDGKGSSDPEFPKLERELKQMKRYLSSVCKDVDIIVDSMKEHDIVKVSLRGRTPETLSTSVDYFVHRLPDNLQYVRTNFRGLDTIKEKLPEGHYFEKTSFLDRLFGTPVMHSPAKTY